VRRQADEASGKTDGLVVKACSCAEEHKLICLGDGFNESRKRGSPLFLRLKAGSPRRRRPTQTPESIRQPSPGPLLASLATPSTGPAPRLVRFHRLLASAPLRRCPPAEARPSDLYSLASHARTMPRPTPRPDSAQLTRGRACTIRRARASSRLLRPRRRPLGTRFAARRRLAS
jgi:hypothetical protein